jgi:hypothetical protein
VLREGEGGHVTHSADAAGIHYFLAKRVKLAIQLTRVKGPVDEPACYYVHVRHGFSHEGVNFRERTVNVCAKNNIHNGTLTGYAIIQYPLQGSSLYKNRFITQFVSMKEEDFSHYCDVPGFILKSMH